MVLGMGPAVKEEEPMQPIPVVAVAVVVAAGP